MPTAPQYVRTAARTTFTVGQTVVTNDGVYIADQPTLDSVSNAAAANGVQLVYSTTSFGGTATAGPTTDPVLADALGLTRIERQARQQIESLNRRASARSADATTLTEAWANTTAWGGSGSVNGGRLYNSSNGLARAISLAAGQRLFARGLVHYGADANQYGFFGVTADTAGGAPSGGTTNVFILGRLNGAAAVIKGTNVAGLPTNDMGGSVPAGDYVWTVVIDDDAISLSLQPLNAGPALPAGTVFSVGIRRSQMPAINNLLVSSSDTTIGANTTYHGALVIVTDASPPLSALGKAPGGTQLFGASNPIVVNRPNSVGVRHIYIVPGTYDPRVPVPFVLYLHEAQIGHAANPLVQANWTNLLGALLTAGYGVASSDNGQSPSPQASGADTNSSASQGAGTGTPVGAQIARWADQFGNPRGMDDYINCATTFRRLFASQALSLLGCSQGGEFVQNLLADRRAGALGGIAAAVSISPSTDLVAVSNLNGYTGSIYAVWGATSPATFAAAIIGYNPVAQSGPKLRGVPQRFYVALDDALTPKATHVDPMVAALAGYPPEAGVVTVPTGGHLAAALYQGSDVVAFLNQYAN